MQHFNDVYLLTIGAVDVVVGLSLTLTGHGHGRGALDRTGSKRRRPIATELRTYVHEA